jgi:hypothetical protein
LVLAFRLLRKSCKQRKRCIKILLFQKIGFGLSVIEMFHESASKILQARKTMHKLFNQKNRFWPFACFEKAAGKKNDAYCFEVSNHLVHQNNTMTGQWRNVINQPVTKQYPNKQKH